MPMQKINAQIGRRSVLKTLGASGASLSLLSSPAVANSTEKLEGVAYDLRTQEILSDATASVTRSATGIKGKVTLGRQTVPLDVGKPDHLERPNAPADQTRYKTRLGGALERMGVKSQLYLLDRPECLAGWIGRFDPNRATKFDRLGFCLMGDYEAARKSIGGGN
jgi:hypothetical protein